MSNVKMINDYLEWRQAKANQMRYLGEEEFSPERWVEETLMSDALVRINLIKDVLEKTNPDPLELANIIHALVYDNLNEPIVVEDPYADDEELQE